MFTMSFYSSDSRLHRLIGFLVVLLFIQIAIPLSLYAQSPMAGTLNRMRILTMRDEFQAHPASYCRKVKQDVSPYIDAVNKVLKDTAQYNKKRDQLIQRLQQQIDQAHDAEQKYAIGKQLYTQYLNLNFEKAYTTARQCEQWARQIGSQSEIVEAQVLQAQAFANSGFFREASETLNALHVEGCTKEVQIAYVMTMFNLEFENGFYMPYGCLPHNIYLDRMQQCYAKMQQLVSADSYLLDDMRVKMSFHQTKYKDAVAQSKILLAKLTPQSPYYAYALGNMGYNYMGMGQYVEAARCVSQSAEIDIKAGSLTYPAMRKMAELAFIVGDVPNSYHMINVAMRNAEINHSRYRYAEIAASYPKIDKDMYAYTQRQTTWLTIALVVLLVVTVLLVVILVVTIRQRRTLHRQKSLIETQMNKLSDKSRQIETINRELLEAGHIKEVVLGQLIVGSANHQAAIMKLRKEVLRRLTIKDYEGLRTVFDTQRGEAFDTFYQLDQILLMLFPQFAEKFNELLRPECRLTLKHDERLTTEMRIFALIRLGITKNDDLAQSLSYSVNTIKSYKTRVIAASLYDKDEFYRRLNEDVATLEQK